MAGALRVELICGIEVSAKASGESIHILGYFIGGGKLTNFRSWLYQLQDSRHQRNLQLAARLGAHGIDIKIEELKSRGGSTAGRPHFAQIIVEKGYASTIQEAFHKYLVPAVPTYVEKNEPSVIESVAEIRRSGGVACLAHLARVSSHVMLLLPAFVQAGINAIEVYHSDHTVQATKSYLNLAEQYGLLATSGSDFHGETKPDVMLGTGRNDNLRIPSNVVTCLKLLGRDEQTDTPTH
jgi:hypothetical protein